MNIILLMLMDQPKGNLLVYFNFCVSPILTSNTFEAMFS